MVLPGWLGGDFGLVHEDSCRIEGKPFRDDGDVGVVEIHPGLSQSRLEYMSVACVFTAKGLFQLLARDECANIANIVSCGVFGENIRNRPLNSRDRRMDKRRFLVDIGVGLVGDEILLTPGANDLALVGVRRC